MAGGKARRGLMRMWRAPQKWLGGGSAIGAAAFPERAGISIKEQSC